MSIKLYHGSMEIVEFPDIRLAKFNKPTHQISFHTVKALTTIKFVGGHKANE